MQYDLFDFVEVGTVAKFDQILHNLAFKNIFIRLIIDGVCTS